ncbi:MAG TPA: hypothetical protein EYP56_12815 [Planctomycetaceae bacterium]|nr:hypothetical protein [Planctomycetaceae bacterium]HIQ22317.1 hypothetical protein [Planctomycetota bacterium]
MSPVDPELVATLARGPCLQAAEQEFDPVGRAEAIARFIDNQTILVAHVELTRIEVNPLVEQLVELMPGPEDDRQRMRKDFQRVLDVFPKAGAKDVYALVSPADLPRITPAFRRAKPYRLVTSKTGYRTRS